MTKPARVLLEARRFRVEEVVQVTPDGVQHPRQVVRHPGAVAVIPLVDNGRVCLVHNYRVAVEKWLYEIPAGTLEPGEDPGEAALRELAEETGYRAGSIERLASFYTSPGVLDEEMHLFVAHDLSPGETDLDPGEDLKPCVMPWQEALAMVRDGRIEDGKTLAGLLFYELFGRRQ